jgi:DNA invertase Pin-like site-specific DNA recombinase
MMQIHRIDPPSKINAKKKNVCAYARVSYSSERLEHSLQTQISYYTDFITSHSDWNNEGVFYDDGISGTTTDRPGLLRMLEKCEDGKIDLILTKSISRFARNTLDLLEIIQHLKELGIEIWFEKENIHTLDNKNEAILTMLASFAQEESRVMSENIKWGIRKRVESGNPRGFYVYGYSWDGEKFHIIPEEAEVIHFMVDSYLEGKSYPSVAAELKAKNIVSRKGVHFSANYISNIIHNPFYTGDLLTQKYYSQSPFGNQKMRNKNDFPRVLFKNHHPAIIDHDQYEKIMQKTKRNGGIKK